MRHAIPITKGQPDHSITIFLGTHTHTLTRSDYSLRLTTCYTDFSMLLFCFRFNVNVIIAANHYRRSMKRRMQGLLHHESRTVQLGHVASNLIFVLFFLNFPRANWLYIFAQTNGPNEKVVNIFLGGPKEFIGLGQISVSRPRETRNDKQGSEYDFGWKEELHRRPVCVYGRVRYR